jgi:hypothetical protein
VVVDRLDLLRHREDKENGSSQQGAEGRSSNQRSSRVTYWKQIRGLDAHALIISDERLTGVSTAESRWPGWVLQHDRLS